MRASTASSRLCTLDGGFRKYLMKARATTARIEVDGFEIGLASEFFCHQGGDHLRLAQCARIDFGQFERTLADLEVLCPRRMKAIPLKRYASSKIRCSANKAINITRL